MCSNFGDPRLHDRKLGLQKLRKSDNFCVKNLLILLIIQKLPNVES